MANSTKKWIGVTLLATLVIGVGVGILVDRLLLVPTVHSRSRDAGHGDGHHREHGKRMVDRLRGGLDLSEEQTSRLEDVMNENHEKARAFWQESRAEYDALRQQFRADIRVQLTAEQRVKFDEMVAEYETRRRQEKGGHHRE